MASHTDFLKVESYVIFLSRLAERVLNVLNCSKHIPSMIKVKGVTVWIKLNLASFLIPFTNQDVGGKASPRVSCGHLEGNIQSP